MKSDEDSCCRECLHVIRIEDGLEFIRPDGETGYTDLYACKRYPPVFIGTSKTNEPRWGYPEVDSEMDCGEWKRHRGRS